MNPEQQMQILNRLDLEDQRLLRETAERETKKVRSTQLGGRLPGLLTSEERQ
jgi:hypothetical protein